MMLIQGDAARIPISDRLVHCVVTSPPYWGMRKYSGDQSRGEFPMLGLEDDPNEYVSRMVEIFREVWRVLRDDGVVWLNLGDCFASVRKGNLSQGNLMMIPHRVAIALQDDGWTVRNDLVWYKRNPMPESVAGWRWEQNRNEKERIIGGGDQAKNHQGSFESPNDGGKDKVIWEYQNDHVLRKGSWRHTRAHEYIFQLTKGMNYYCNQEAVREVVSEHSDFRVFIAATPYGENSGKAKGLGRGSRGSSAGRNPRSVLDVPTAPYKGAHYATFPSDLIAPLIRASCPRRSCPKCGQAWTPVVERLIESTWPLRKKLGAIGGAMIKGPIQQTGETRTKKLGLRFLPSSGGIVIEYRSTCEHDLDPVPGIVLDPFAGSGTTGMVAKELLRRWICVDLSFPYLDEQAKVRTKTGMLKKAVADLPLFSM